MLALSLLSLSIAHADIAIPPPENQRFVKHDLVVEGLEAHPGVVLLVMDSGETASAYRAFRAGGDTRQTLARGSRRRGGGMSAPSIRMLPAAAFDAWEAEARADVNRQREACAEEGRGCAHISRFVGRYPAPQRAIDCGIRLDLVTTGPEDGPNTMVDTVALETATDTRCVVESKGRSAEIDGRPVETGNAPAGVGGAPNGPGEAPATGGGCDATGGAASVGAGLALLGLAARRRRDPALLLLASLTSCTPRANLRGLAIEQDLAAGRAGGGGTVDHAAWGRVLAAAVDEPAGRIDYGAVPRTDLDAALTTYGGVDLKSLGAPEQEALLINAYNAFTVQLIVSQPTRPASIRDLDDPWGTARWTLGGHRVSLDDIEHGLLRPLYKDPRLHFALNCASVGCPPLRGAPYTAASLDTQLDTAARDTLSRAAWLRVEDGKLHTTKLLDWYGGDFTAEGWSPIASSKAAWLARFGPPAVQAAIDARGGDPDIVYVDYDWSLNQRGP